MIEQISFFDGNNHAVLRDENGVPHVVQMSVEEAISRGWSQVEQELEHDRNRHVSVTPLIHRMWPRLFGILLIVTLTFPVR